jgi:hypothetical protein
LRLHLPDLPIRRTAAASAADWRTPRLAALALAGCEAAGMAGVVAGYHFAQSTSSSTAEFVWFWAGMCLMVLPLVALAVRPATSPAVRTALLAMYGLVSYAPKLLRSPGEPLYHDELAHWRETHDVLATGLLFRPNPIITIIARYPGLHATTAALVHITGLTIWQAAILLLLLCHVALVVGIAVLARAIGLAPRTAAVAAMIYGLNPSFLYFDTQFAYESMAITLVVWTLAAFAWAIRSQRWQSRAPWSVLTVVFTAGTVVTHHLSELLLVLIMMLISAAMSVPWLARREGWVGAAATAWGLTLIAACLVAAWFTFAAPTTASYLSPYLGGGLSQLIHIAGGAGSGRHLFAASLSPWWEQKSAYMVTVFALFLAISGLLLIRNRILNGSLPRGGRRALLAAFAVLGLIYFPSVLFIFSPLGAEGARRSWAFSWIGLCILASPAALILIDWTARRTRRWAIVILRCGLLAALAIALIGGTAAGADASYRFPGPFLYGSDTRSITPELQGTSAWFASRFGPGNRIVTDRYTGLIFASFGLQDPAAPSAGFPVYNLYLAKHGAAIRPAYLLYDLRDSHYTYLIVDGRMAYELPQLGEYFDASEPAAQFAPHNGRPVFYGRLGKFDTIPWTIKVFQSDNYRIYRFDLPAGNASYNKPPRLRGKFEVTK